MKNIQYKQYQNSNLVLVFFLNCVFYNQELPIFHIIIYQKTAKHYFYSTTFYGQGIRYSNPNKYKNKKYCTTIMSLIPPRENNRNKLNTVIV